MNELFKGCENSLVTVNFSAIEISDLPRDLFGGCKKLKFIFFKENKLKNLDKELFKDFKNSWEMINFSSNVIEKLPENIFNGCNELMFLLF